MQKNTKISTQITRLDSGVLHIDYSMKKRKILISKYDLFAFLLCILLLIIFFLIKKTTFSFYAVGIGLYITINYLSIEREVLDLQKIIIDDYRLLFIYKDDTKNRATIIGNRDFLNYEIQISEKRVVLEVLGEIIELNNPSDLPIVMDGLADLMGFEFYDTQQKDEKEIIMYRKKRL